MIVGVGVDVVQISRIRALVARRAERFLQKVFAPEELDPCLSRSDPAPSLAARFAAKEAGMKALGTGWGQGVGWRDLRIVGAAGAPPRLLLSGRARDTADVLGVTGAHLSMSHDGDVATAFVVLEARGGMS